MDLAERLDDIGKPAWAALTIVSFIIWWPLGLAALAFLFWSRRMGCGHHGDWHERRERWREARQEWRAWRDERQATRHGGGYGLMQPSGNAAFDGYRAETLKRLEEEQQEFASFLNRLRQSKDQAEFEQFMAERQNKPQNKPLPDPSGSAS